MFCLVDGIGYELFGVFVCEVVEYLGVFLFCDDDLGELEFGEVL